MKAIILLLAAALGASASGCTVYAQPASAAVVDTTYEPMYYDGRVVYYNDAGLPYYYQGDHITYVPRTHASFGLYVNHYNRYRPAYRHWYRVEGPRYRHVYRPRYDRRRYHAPPPRYHHAPSHPHHH